MTKMTKEEKRIEREASRFAICLLMPRTLVTQWIEENGKVDLEDPGAIRKFADKFNVSSSLAAIRLSEIQSEL